jgi:hypothetical protein
VLPTTYEGPSGRLPPLLNRESHFIHTNVHILETGRRVRDLNPWSPKGRLISNQVHSTALPTLLETTVTLYTE